MLLGRNGFLLNGGLDAGAELGRRGGVNRFALLPIVGPLVGAHLLTVRSFFHFHRVVQTVADVLLLHDLAALGLVERGFRLERCSIIETVRSIRAHGSFGLRLGLDFGQLRLGGLTGVRAVQLENGGGAGLWLRSPLLNLLGRLQLFV